MILLGPPAPCPILTCFKMGFNLKLCSLYDFEVCCTVAMLIRPEYLQSS